MSEDDNNNNTKSACGFNILMFILTIIVFTNVNVTLFASGTCDVSIEFQYIEYTLYASIASMIALIGLIFSILCETIKIPIQFICTSIILASFIIQIYCMGDLWHKYPKQYLIFYKPFWNSLRVDCIDSNKRWAYLMMGVMIKITTGAFMIGLVLFATCGSIVGLFMYCFRDSNPTTSSITRTGYGSAIVRTDPLSRV